MCVLAGRALGAPRADSATGGGCSAGRAGSPARYPAQRSWGGAGRFTRSSIGIAAAGLTPCCRDCPGRAGLGAAALARKAEVSQASRSLPCGEYTFCSNNPNLLSLSSLMALVGFAPSLVLCWGIIFAQIATWTCWCPFYQTPKLG